MIKVYIESLKKDYKFIETLDAFNKLINIDVVSDPKDAEAILMTDDEYIHIKNSTVFYKYISKCVAINDGDIMSYYIPGLYSSNFRWFLSRGRALTAGHYLSLLNSEKRNGWIDRLKGQSSERRLLYSFMGGSTCWLRKRLLKQYQECASSDVLVRGTDHYKHWAPGDQTAKSAQQRLYAETLFSSKFALCPRGSSASSVRLYEAMELGCAPVVLADSWIPVDGVDWSFCLFVKERELPNLDAIIRSHSDEWEERGAAARRTFEENFAPDTLGYLFERQMRELIATRSEARERFVRTIYPLLLASWQSKERVRAAARELVLFGFRSLGRKFPYALNR